MNEKDFRKTIREKLYGQSDGLDCGFAVNTGDSYLLDANFEEDFGREMTDEEKEKLSSRRVGLGRIEDNMIQFLDIVFESVSSEGHGSDGALIGSAWCQWNNEPALTLVAGGNANRDVDMWGNTNEIQGSINYTLPKAGYKGPDLDLYEGVEDWIARISDVTLEFFDITDDEYEKILDIITVSV